MAIINNPAVYVKPNMKYMRPAEGTQQAIVRQELDNYLTTLPQKVYSNVDEGVANIVAVGKQIGGVPKSLAVGTFNDAQTASLNGLLKNKLPEQQAEIAKALGVYTGDNAYIPINTGLRGKEIIYDDKFFPQEGQPVYEAQRQLARNVVDAIDELPQHQGVVYRGTVIPTSVDVASTYKPGTTFVDKGIGSSSYMPHEAEYFSQPDLINPGRGINFEISSKYGRETPNTSEGEVIFLPGTRYQIKDVKPDQYKPTVILEDLGTPIDRAVEYQQQSSSIGSQPSGLITTANRLGQQAAVANPVDSVPVIPQKKAKFVVDQNSGQVQSFVDKGDGQYIPHKQYNVSDARKAYGIAKDNGWTVEHEFVGG